MKKKYKELTEEQKARGVIFSSELVGGGIVHEVLKDDEDKNVVIARLLNDRFFNDSPYKYNLIRR
jgi:hypothetical protein